MTIGHCIRLFSGSGKFVFLARTQRHGLCDGEVAAGGCAAEFCECASARGDGVESDVGVRVINVPVGDGAVRGGLREVGVADDVGCGIAGSSTLELGGRRIAFAKEGRGGGGGDGINSRTRDCGDSRCGHGLDDSCSDDLSAGCDGFSHSDNTLCWTDRRRGAIERRRGACGGARETACSKRRSVGNV
jgi:hypothetical protein